MNSDSRLDTAFDQTVTATESARLLDEEHVRASVQERDRIANAVHDDIIQTIYSVGLTLDSCRLGLRERPADVEALLDEATAGLNQAIKDIRISVLDLARHNGEQLQAASHSESGGSPRLSLDEGVVVVTPRAYSSPHDRLLNEVVDAG